MILFNAVLGAYSILLNNNCYWMSLLRSDEKFYGLTGIFNYPKAMPSEGWVGWVEPKIEHNGKKILIKWPLLLFWQYTMWSYSTSDPPRTRCCIHLNHATLRLISQLILNEMNWNFDIQLRADAMTHLKYWFRISSIVERTNNSTKTINTSFERSGSGLLQSWRLGAWHSYWPATPTLYDKLNFLGEEGVASPWCCQAPVLQEFFCLLSRLSNEILYVFVPCLLFQ